jgi:hypothetical protein
MESKIIVIGLNPSKARTTKRGPALKKLYQWADHLGLPIFSFTNLSDDPDWDFKFKSINQNFVLQSVQNYDIIVALGKTTSNYLKRLGVSNVFTMPHPSPRNRLLNNHDYEMEMLEKLNHYVRTNEIL